MSTIYVVVLTYIKPLEEVDRAIPPTSNGSKGYADGLFLASGRRIPAPAASFWQNAIAGKLCKRV